MPAGFDRFERGVLLNKLKKCMGSSCFVDIVVFCSMMEFGASAEFGGLFWCALASMVACYLLFYSTHVLIKTLSDNEYADYVSKIFLICSMFACDVGIIPIHYWPA